MPDSSPDIPERLLVRTLSHDFLACLAGYCDILRLDMVGMLVFTGVWTANTGHLTDTARFAQRTDLPPDHYRRPVGLNDLAQRLRMPTDLVADRVSRLEALALLEVDARGIWVPKGVFTRDEVLGAFQATLDTAAALAATMTRHGMIARVA